VIDEYDVWVERYRQDQTEVLVHKPIIETKQWKIIHYSLSNNNNNNNKNKNLPVNAMKASVGTIAPGPDLGIS
jgi:hypothetical protein